MARQTPIEELDLPVLAYNFLKAQNLEFIEDIQPYVDRASHPLSPTNPNWRRVEATITERLRRWRDDSGDAGVRSRR